MIPLAFAALLVATPVGAANYSEIGVYSGKLAIIDGDRIAYFKDGDSFVLTTGEEIRIRSERGPIDAPENSVKGRSPAKCPLELFRAQAAKDRLAAILNEKPVCSNSGPASCTGVYIDRRGLDRYRRTVAIVWLDGEDVGARLVSEGHAKMWMSLRKKDRPTWCGPQ